MEPNWKMFAGRLALLVGIAIMAVPVVYWGANSDLTQMQIFMKFWWCLLLGVPAFGYGLKTITE